MTKFLIIGPNGFLGSHFVDKLKDQAITLSRQEFDLRESLLEKEVYSHSNFEYIIHCALSKDNSEQEKIDSNIIDWWQRFHKDSMLVTFGTDALYSPENEHNELNYCLDEPYEQWKEYAETKRKLFEHLNTITSSKWQHLIISSLFGANFDPDDEHLIPSLIKKIDIASQYKNSKVNVGDSHYVRECVYAPDVVENTVAIIEHKLRTNQPLNIGAPSKMSSIERIVDETCKVVGFPFERIVFNPTDKGHSEKWLDCSYVQAVFKVHDLEYKDTSYFDALTETYRYWKRIRNSWKKFHLL